MIEKIAIGGAVWAALQLSVIDIAGDQAGAALAQAGHIQQVAQSQACAQAKAYDLELLKRRGLEIRGCE